MNDDFDESVEFLFEEEEYSKRTIYSRFFSTFSRVFKTPTSKLGGCVFAVILLAAVLAPVLAPFDPLEMYPRERFQTPSLSHLCGTDSYGRDIFSRILHGAKYSLSLAFAAEVMGVTVGVILGSIAGYFGGKVEQVIMRFCDIWQAIPGLLMTIILSATLGPGFFNTIIALSIGGIPSGARMTRALILAERSKEYLEAAESINCSKLKIMFSHLLPNVISPTLVSITMGFGNAMVLAAGLSFLGLGIQPPIPEWGALLADGTGHIMKYPYMILYPGIMIGICVLSVNLMGDGVRDALDPKLRS